MSKMQNAKGSEEPQHQSTGGQMFLQTHIITFDYTCMNILSGAQEVVKHF